MYLPPCARGCGLQITVRQPRGRVPPEQFMRCSARWPRRAPGSMSVASQRRSLVNRLLASSLESIVGVRCAGARPGRCTRPAPLAGQAGDLPGHVWSVGFRHRAGLSCPIRVSTHVFEGQWRFTPHRDRPRATYVRR
jgi:hypothetical protein